MARQHHNLSPDGQFEAMLSAMRKLSIAPALDSSEDYRSTGGELLEGIPEEEEDTFNFLGLPVELQEDVLDYVYLPIQCQSEFVLFVLLNSR